MNKENTASVENQARFQELYRRKVYQNILKPICIKKVRITKLYIPYKVVANSRYQKQSEKYSAIEVIKYRLNHSHNSYFPGPVEFCPHFLST